MISPTKASSAYQSRTYMATARRVRLFFFLKFIHGTRDKANLHFGSPTFMQKVSPSLDNDFKHGFFLMLSYFQFKPVKLKTKKEGIK